MSHPDDQNGGMPHDLKAELTVAGIILSFFAALLVIGIFIVYLILRAIL